MTDDGIRVKCGEAIGLGGIVPGTGAWYGYDKLGDAFPVPNFTTSVDAALTLSDKLREEDFDVLITIEKTGYTVNVYIGQMALAEIEDLSLARAICLAFLKVQDSIANSP